MKLHRGKELTLELIEVQPRCIMDLDKFFEFVLPNGLPLTFILIGLLGSFLAAELSRVLPFHFSLLNLCFLLFDLLLHLLEFYVGHQPLKFLCVAE